ncbi:MAG: DUF2971 domain-containing protein [Oscillospiraceae bacterium]|nr:DUF2971 domain-containing protein [Oscillospiraceae bacterium]
MQPDKLLSIAIKYPKLNIGWLLTGQGEMELPNENGDYTPRYNPNLLQHYTKPEGLIGILNDMELKFSKVERSNDIKERRLWMHDTLKDLRKEEKTEEAKKYKYISFFVKDEIREVRQPKMYDLYADYHKGGCIEFNKEKLESLNKHLDIDFCEVTYNKYSLRQQSTVRDELKHKYYQWRDEKECRIIYYGDADRIYLNKDCIERIYLGCEFFNDKINVAEFCSTIEKADISIEKITEVTVTGLAHLTSISDINSPYVTRSIAAYHAARLIPYFSDEYRKKYKLVSHDPQIKIDYVAERRYQNKYHESLEEKDVLNREIRRLNEEIKEALRLSLSLKDRIEALRDELGEVKNDLAGKVAGVITALTGTDS